MDGSCHPPGTSGVMPVVNFETRHKLLYPASCLSGDGFGRQLNFTTLEYNGRNLGNKFKSTDRPTMIDDRYYGEDISMVAECAEPASRSV